MSQQNTENTDYDNPWKSFIELYFRDFLQFFFPAIESDIDWSRPIRFGRIQRLGEGDVKNLPE
jgi:hypothetical protein